MNNDSNVKLRLNNSELWGGLIGLALGIFVIWSGLKLKLGTINDPGSGYVLFYTGILMCVFAVTIIAAAIVVRARMNPLSLFMMAPSSALRPPRRGAHGPRRHRDRHARPS